MKRGNCYVTSEALYHLLGGKAAGLKPMQMHHEGESHWFSEYTFGPSWDRQTITIDPTIKQFKTTPDYSMAKGRGFLTKKPSKRAKKLMEIMLWQSQN